MPADASNTDAIIGVNGGNAGNMGPVSDIVAGIIEVIAVIPDKAGLLDALPGMLDTVAVDAGIEDGDLYRGVTGRNVPPPWGIDIGI